MLASDIIKRKRDGGCLSRNELDWLLQGCCNGAVPAYQLTAWLMAVYFKGMTVEETVDLTLAMLNSGTQIDLSGLPLTADKHSTGGVGDKISLVALPLAAAAGMSVAKMSGRGLGHTGGTIDKLQSIPGLQTEISSELFMQQVRACGLAIISQTAELVPADKKLYALRDVTATVDSLPLIASSIMSKKLASGAQTIVLDVKMGKGAFLPDPGQTIKMAELMVQVGNRMQRKTSALLSNMDQPLGFCVGNALEVEEAIAVLKGDGPQDVRILATAVASQMVYSSGLCPDLQSAEALIAAKLSSGAGLAKLREMIIWQHGDAGVLEQPQLLPQAEFCEPVLAGEEGFVAAVDALQIARAASLVGAGRKTKEDYIDPAAGVRLNKKTGDKVARGEVLAWLYHNGCSTVPVSRQAVQEAYQYSVVPPVLPQLIYGIVDCNGLQKLSNF